MIATLRFFFFFNDNFWPKRNYLKSVLPSLNTKIRKKCIFNSFEISQYKQRKKELKKLLIVKTFSKSKRGKKGWNEWISKNWSKFTARRINWFTNEWRCRDENIQKYIKCYEENYQFLISKKGKIQLLDALKYDRLILLIVLHEWVKLFHQCSLFY